MRKFVYLGLLGLLHSSQSLFAQNINIPADSIQVLLCKKWEVDYALIGGMRIDKLPGATEINYEFNKDKTFILFSADPKDRSKGTWIYDPKKKLIKLTINGISNTNIISLKEGQLVMSSDMKEATPDEPTAIQTVYKLQAK